MIKYANILNCPLYLPDFLQHLMKRFGSANSSQ